MHPLHIAVHHPCIDDARTQTPARTPCMSTQPPRHRPCVHVCIVDAPCRAPDVRRDTARTPSITPRTTAWTPLAPVMNPGGAGAYASPPAVGAWFSPKLPARTPGRGRQRDEASVWNAISPQVAPEDVPNPPFNEFSGVLPPLSTPLQGVSSLIFASSPPSAPRVVADDHQRDTRQGLNHPP